MVISEDSQLGLRFKKNNVKVNLLNLMQDRLVAQMGLTKESIALIDRKMAENKILLSKRNEALTEQEILECTEIQELISQNIERLSNKETDALQDKLTQLINIADLVDCKDTKHFFICDSVYKAAELIHIKENFTGRTLKDIDLGKYTYLMGKNKMVRFQVIIGFIKGFFYNDKEEIEFDFGIEMETGKYCFTKGFDKEFSDVMKILTFIELGDIEIKTMAGLSNNGKKGNDKIYNANLKTVFVVDSTWNQILIRTDGFAVRGHFRLQPCGIGLIDRKLTWISAFEKFGYKRRPKGEIIK